MRKHRVYGTWSNSRQNIGDVLSHILAAVDAHATKLDAVSTWFFDLRDHYTTQWISMTTKR